MPTTYISVSGIPTLQNLTANVLRILAWNSDAALLIEQQKIFVSFTMRPTLLSSSSVPRVRIRLDHYSCSKRYKRNY
ncbi:14848_t:CDS:2 [Funneliformis mosseae]|uniref:14848_t:CDS:1 n=1 Tax=Funneliformis mosseae TaxID=27381 RepID=A0A9N9C8X5_FUNMO|nr:14848_t:CDS:2 [Funneliformis mosseae]